MAQTEHSVLVIGAFREETTRRVQQAAQAAGSSCSFVSGCSEARARVDAERPLAIVLRMDASGAQDVCAHVRSHARLADVPIFGVATGRSDLAFTEIFSWGGDDVVSLWSPQPLARRLRPLAARPSTGETPPPSDRCALVAGPDPRWRTVMGRALYSGGFSVRFVASGEEAAQESRAQSVKLVVAVEDVAPDGVVQALEGARAQGSEAAWIVVTPPKRMAITSAAVRAFERVTVTDAFSPPENALFLANELLARRGGVDQRSSARLLYGTSVTFRPAGRDEDEIGFSYNVSAAGVYVRTLAPLDAGQDVWLEMWPPRSERRVRLSGVVAWKRSFGTHERATVPAGFGVRIVDGLGGDLDRWRAGYDAFAESMLGARSAAASSPEL